MMVEFCPKSRKMAFPKSEQTAGKAAIREDQDLFTAKDAEDAKEEKNLPRINTDERGFKNQTSFTTEDTKDTEEKNQDSPLIHTDDTDLKEEGRDIAPESEFVHVPGGFGFERVRLRIEPGVAGERKPPQAIIGPQECAEVHANLG